MNLVGKDKPVMIVSEKLPDVKKIFPGHVKRLAIQVCRACERRSGSDFQMHGESLRSLKSFRFLDEVYIASLFYHHE